MSTSRVSLSVLIKQKIFILAAAALAALSGCSVKEASGEAAGAPPQAPPPVAVAVAAPVCTVDSFRQPPAPVSGKTDVLFVMDHSQSMGRHWQLIARGIGRLIRALPPGHDTRFAVVLGSLTKHKGALFSAPGVPKVLDGRRLSEAQVAWALGKTFEHALAYENIDWKGAGEALFYSLHHAVTSRAAQNQRQGFFRPDAALSVIFMSDDAEEGYPYPSRQVWDLPPKCNWSHHETIRKSFYVPYGVNTASTLTALRRLKGDMPLLTSAFVNITREDILVDNDLHAKCIYDSPGFGYFDIVKGTGGLLYSIHDDRGAGLELAGRMIRGRSELLHDFKLSRPATQVDPVSIEASVDGAREEHSYSPDASTVHLERAGGPGSLIEIRHCEPPPPHDWTLVGFEGEAAQSGASLRWSTPGHPTSGKVLYGLAPDALNDEALDPARAISHAVEISGLSPNTVYYFQAVSADELGAEKRSEVISLRTRPDWSMGEVKAQASRTSASVSWSTIAFPTVGKVLWGLSPDLLDHGTAESGAQRDHVIVIEGLEPDTVYYFQAISRDGFGLEKAAETVSLRTRPDWGVVGFSGRASRTTASFAWQTPEEDTAGRIRYGLSPDSLTESAEDGTIGRAHALGVAGLAPGTVYYFQAEARGQDGHTRRSAVLSVRTLSDWFISGLSSSPSESTVVLSFATTGYPTDAKVLWGVNPAQLSGSVDAGAGSESHEAVVTGLLPDTLYFFQATAQDDLGLERRSAVFSVRTKSLPEPLPRWVISDLEGHAGPESVTLAWQTADYPTTGRVLWGLSPDALQNEASESVEARSHELAVDGLLPEAYYYFQVVARDDKGQEQSSSVIAVRTQAAPLPSWEISGLAAVPAATSVSLAWDTSAYLTTGRVRWGLSQGDLGNETIAGPAGTAHAVTVSGLQPRTTYYFQAVSADDRGQWKQSAVIQATTTFVPPSWSIVGFDGTTTTTEANLIWTTPGAATRATLRVGLSATDLSFRTIDLPSLSDSHLVTVSGLVPGTTYYFQVAAEDANGGWLESGVIIKRTKNP